MKTRFANLGFSALFIFSIFVGLTVLPDKYNPILQHASANGTVDFKNCPTGTQPSYVTATDTSSYSAVCINSTPCNVVACLQTYTSANTLTVGFTNVPGSMCGFGGLTGSSTNSNLPPIPTQTGGQAGSNGAGITLVEQLSGAGGTYSIGAIMSLHTPAGNPYSINTGTVTVTSTYTANTLYPFYVSFPCIWTARGGVDYTIAAGEQVCASTNGGTVCNTAVGSQINGATNPFSQLFFTQTATVNQYISTLTYITPPPLIAPTAQVCKQSSSCGSNPGALTGWTGNLVGFDADPYANSIIVRTGEASPHDKIRAFNPVSLAQIGASPLANGCGKVDGVLTYSQYPPGTFWDAFLDCTSPTQADTFSIRGADLNQPNFAGTLCATYINGCATDLHTSTAPPQSNCNNAGAANPSQLPGSSSQIGNIVSIPISYSRSFNPSIGSLSSKNTYVGYALTDTGNGNVGFWVTKLVNTAIGQGQMSCAAEASFVPGGSAINQICTFHYINTTFNQPGTTSGDYLVAVTGGVAGKMWNLKVDNLFTSTGDTDPPYLEINAAGPSLPTVANGVACGSSNDVIIVGTDGSVGRYHVLDGADYTQPVYLNGVAHYPSRASVGQRAWLLSGASTFTTSNSRGITVDDTESVGAYVASSTVINVFNATNGITIATITMPSGTFYGMKMTRNGQTLYIATSTNIARYDIAGSGVVPVLCERCNHDGSTQNSDGTNSNTPTGSPGPTTSAPLGLNSNENILGINVTFVSNGLNISRTTTLILIAIMLIVVGFMWIYRGTESIIGGLFGAFLGLILAVAMSLVPQWVMLIIALVILLMFGKLLFGGLTSSDEA